jgi:hypothetical protein
MLGNMVSWLERTAAIGPAAAIAQELQSANIANQTARRVSSEMVIRTGDSNAEDANIALLRALLADKLGR